MKEKRKERQEKGHAGKRGGGERDEVRERGRKRGRVVALGKLSRRKEKKGRRQSPMYVYAKDN